MIYRLAAHSVVLLHYAFIVFALIGGFGVCLWPPLIWLHLPVLLWAVAIARIGWTCPLTPLENRLRQAGGLTPYSGGFIEHYLTARYYPDGLPRTVLAGMGALVLGINMLAYGLFYFRLAD